MANAAGIARGSLGTALSGGGSVALSSAIGIPTVQITGADTSTNGARIQLARGDGTLTVDINGDRSINNGAGYIGIYNGSGTRTAYIVGEDGTGSSRVRTQILEITGGSDLSENFDINSGNASIEPGMIVCIDSDNPGQLVASTKAYDSAVAGIVSGAGGVRPGMLMGQHGNPINGKHPVALSGRVYCLVDADLGRVRPGDLITTSDTPGHGMKAADPARSHGAIIGKAMTVLESGQGLVLVLVSLQ